MKAEIKIQKIIKIKIIRRQRLVDLVNIYIYIHIYIYIYIFIYIYIYKGSLKATLDTLY